MPQSIYAGGAASSADGGAGGLGGAALNWLPGPALKECTREVRPASDDGLIEDFEGEELGRWLAQGSFEPKDADGSIRLDEAVTAGGAVTPGNALGMSSTGLEGYNSVFVVMGHPIDATAFDGIVFSAKVGENTPTDYRVRVADINTYQGAGPNKTCVVCNDDFAKAFTFTTEWTSYSLSFAELEMSGFGDPRPDYLNKEHLYNLWFTIGGGVEGQPAELWLDDLSLGTCD